MIWGLEWHGFWRCKLAKLATFFYVVNIADSDAEERVNHSLIEILKLKFGLLDSEAEFWSICDMTEKQLFW